MKKFLLAFGIATFLNACGGEIETSEEKIIIGSNDLEYYTDDNKISRSIGKMALGCTVTHVGEGIVITAGHCIKSTNCSSSSYNVTWGYTNDNRSGNSTSKCVEVLAHEFSNSRDYALLKYDNTPEEFLPLNGKDRPQYGDKVTIFSHPEGVPLAWSGWCSHEGEHSGKRFEYRCSTKGGSSGAAVLNEDLEIVGVHNQGSAFYGVNAGTYVIDIPEL